MQWQFYDASAQQINSKWPSLLHLQYTNSLHYYKLTWIAFGTSRLAVNFKDSIFKWTKNSKLACIANNFIPIVAHYSFRSMLFIVQHCCIAYNMPISNQRFKLTTVITNVAMFVFENMYLMPYDFVHQMAKSVENGFENIIEKRRRSSETQNEF